MFYLLLHFGHDAKTTQRDRERDRDSDRETGAATQRHRERKRDTERERETKRGDAGHMVDLLLRFDHDARS